MKKDKKPIVENLRNWYTIDSILLNEHAHNVFAKGTDFKEYLALKAALLSNLFEFHKHIGFKPSGDMVKCDKVLQESAVKTAKFAKESAARMIQRPEFKKHIKEYIVRESTEKEIKDRVAFSRKVISERFMRMALDNALVGVPLLECTAPEKAKDFQGEILEEAYRMLRTSLIHHVKTSPIIQKKT